MKQPTSCLTKLQAPSPEREARGYASSKSLIHKYRSQPGKTCLAARLGAIFLLALLVRAAPFGLYITPDEPIWILRSVHFADAVAARDGSMMPQTGHPGVTTMALGALGVRLMQAMFPTQAAEHLAWIRNITWLAPENDAAFTHLAFFLPASRLFVILVTSLAIVGVYGLARRRTGERAARWLVLFLALDPFLAGLSGLLHTDALQATFGMLAVLWLLPTKASPRMMSLTASALCLALAGMTKTLGLLIAPGLALSLLINGRPAWSRRLLHTIALTLLTGVFTLALYPPFWHDPEAALHTLTSAIGYHESLGLREVFFLGQMSPDPGGLFYPVVLLFRLSPPVLLGIILAGYAWITHSSRSHDTNRWFMLPALIYLLGITAATKKFDRYALSAMLLLSSIAAQFWAQCSRRWAYALGVMLLLSWVIVAPLPLYYANPLLGGPGLARKLIPLGWGEASGLAASHANRVLSEAETRALLTSNVPGAASFFSGSTLSWEASLIPCVDALISAEGKVNSRHAVVTETLRLAGMPLTTLTTQSPAWPTELPLVWPGSLPGRPSLAWIAPRADNAALQSALAQQLPVGAAFTWVQAPACYPLTTAQLNAILREPAVGCEPAMYEILGLTTSRCVIKHSLPDIAPYRGRFAGDLDLIATAWPEAIQAPEALAVYLRWRPQVILEDHSVYLALRDAENTIWVEGGHKLVDARNWPASAWETGNIIDSTAYVPLPLHLPPGTYTVTLTLFDPANRQLGIALPDGTFGGTQLPLGKVELLMPAYPAPELELPQEIVAQFPGLRLIGAAPPPEACWTGDMLHFSLGWERVAGDVESTLQWELVCEGNIRDSSAMPIAASVHQWPVGYRYVTHHTLRIRRFLDTSAGKTCTLRVRVGQTTPVAIGTLHIQPRNYSFEFPQSPQIAQNIIVGDFARLSGVDLPTTSLAPGETLSVTLYWEARKAATWNYTVFVHVVGPDGFTWTQSDQWPARSPTMAWIAQQAILDHHALDIPGNAPPGDYEIFVGMYDAIQGLRVPLYGPQLTQIPDNRARVGTIRVTP